MKLGMNNNVMTYPMAMPYMYPPYPFVPYPPVQPMDCAPVYPCAPYYYPIPPNQIPTPFPNSSNTGNVSIPQHQASKISLDNNNNNTMTVPPMNINTENRSNVVNPTCTYPEQQQQMVA